MVAAAISVSIFVVFWLLYTSRLRTGQKLALKEEKLANVQKDNDRLTRHLGSANARLDTSRASQQEMNAALNNLGLMDQVLAEIRRIEVVVGIEPDDRESPLPAPSPPKKRRKTKKQREAEERASAKTVYDHLLEETESDEPSSGTAEQSSKVL